jgi:hypothetical protein
VLARDDVFDVKRSNESESLGQQAVFALQSGTTPDSVAEGGVHQAFRDLSSRLALDWSTAMRSPSRT